MKWDLENCKTTVRGTHKNLADVPLFGARILVIEEDYQNTETNVTGKGDNETLHVLRRVINHRVLSEVNIERKFEWNGANEDESEEDFVLRAHKVFNQVREMYNGEWDTIQCYLTFHEMGSGE